MTAFLGWLCSALAWIVVLSFACVLVGCCVLGALAWRYHREDVEAERRAELLRRLGAR